ncbi:MAG: hypothetical protein WA173_16850, partial [Pseudomonas sp.]|uniref:hypothetical protein n=1 Tax=Pseudomonas sp. TaxID=306 RepID=UPI003BB5D26D
MLINKSAWLLAACGLLTACSSTTYQQANKALGDNLKQVDQLNKLAAQPMPKADTSLVPLRTGHYLGTTVLKRQSGQDLPPRFELDGVRLLAGGPQELLAIGQLITEATGIPVAFASDIFAESKTRTAAPPRSAATPGQAQDEAGRLAAALDAALPRGAGSMA